MKLLETYNQNNLNLKNRIVMAPMTRCRADNEELKATDLIAEYYQQRASAGLIISEGTFINGHAIGYINVPNIYTKNQIEGWKKVTAAVHEKGGKIFAQLWHVGSISHPDLLEGKLPLAPSAVNPHFKCFTKNGFQDTIVPKEMTPEDIEQTIVDFQQAAMNAIEAGFDGVELHGANGYLLHQFFAKCSNLRNDNYGGTLEKRAKILFDILDRISVKIPLSKVGVRIAPSLHNTFGIVTDDETDALFEYITTRLNDYSLAYLHISGFSMDTIEDPFEFVWDTAKRYRALYNGTLIINKGFTKDTANKAIEEGIADMVSFGELFISNPDLAERFEQDLPLQAADRSTYYVPGPKGYTDYPVVAQR
ncbi:MAG: alkene reductase [Bacteroidota bacterium]|jgi:N-ethylmaleimide reductase